MKSEDLHFLRIHEALEKIDKFLTGKSQRDLENDEMLYDAVLMELMVIGEEAARLSDKTKEALPDVPWHKMIGMRNRITHEYFHIDPKIVWHTFKIDLPELKQKLNTK